jgi:flagellar basal-body rod protein FlgC
MGNGLFGSFKISATGMRGQRVRMDVISQNLANAETTRTTEGTPYRRQRAVFERILDEKLARLSALRGGRDGASRIDLTRTREGHLESRLRRATPPPDRGLEVGVGVAPDASEFRVVYDPGHPDADDEGYVLLPNVNVIEEMVDMIAASRAYEANVSAVQSAKEMFNRALSI